MVGMQDMIARAGRFWGLYKRAGHRVMINPSGDLIVRPTFIEAAAQLMRPWSESDCAAPPPALLHTPPSLTLFRPPVAMTLPGVAEELQSYRHLYACVFI